MTIATTKLIKHRHSITDTAISAASEKDKMIWNYCHNLNYLHSLSLLTTIVAIVDIVTPISNDTQIKP